jgi:antitoxin YefM
MLAVNYSTLRDKLKEYCDRVTDDYETVIVTRKEEKNVVIIGLDEYNRLMKAKNNLEYLNKLDRSIAQMKEGKCQVHDIIEVDDAEDLD